MVVSKSGRFQQFNRVIFDSNGFLDFSIGEFIFDFSVSINEELVIRVVELDFVLVFKVFLEVLEFSLFWEIGEDIFGIIYTVDLDDSVVISTKSRSSGNLFFKDLVTSLWVFFREVIVNIKKRVISDDTIGRVDQ